jgi:two-component system sensor histidine kinase BarA
LLAGLAASVLAALYLGSSLGRGLSELISAMTRYRQGDTETRVARQGLAELDELARGFNRMAAALEQAQQSMQRRIDGATRELQWSLATLHKKNVELEQARAAAIAANRNKDEFLARMSHEMRTPLNAVIGFGRLLHEEARTDASHAYSQTLERAARQLLSVIDDLLNYAKLRAGPLLIDAIPFDLRACVEDIVAMLGPDASAQGLELALAVHNDVPERVIGDPARLGQVLLNLLNNAVKFTLEGHVFVEAGYHAGSGDSGRIRISVSDTGIGLPAAEQERLFQPFEQADPVITRRYGGTGLGLAITKRLIERMDGTISVASTPGQGSRFTVELPCRVADRAAPAPSTAALAGRKVLVCDPAAIQIRALRSLLTGAGIAVFTTTRLARLGSMLEQAERDAAPFDLVLLGTGSPLAADRLEEQLGAIRCTFNGPILLLVGEQGWIPPTDLLVAQAPLTWTMKPARRGRLLALLSELCDQSQAPAPPAATPRLRWPGLRALVVDDNEFNRALMRSLLEVRGMQVVEAENGAQAEQLVAERHLDLVLMDIHMPGVDGVEVTRRIRTAPPGASRLRVIALSADAFMGGRSAERSSLFDGFLLKPVAEDELDAALKQAFAGGGRITTPLGATRPDEANQWMRRPISLDAAWHARLNAAVSDQLARIKDALAAGDRQGLRAQLHDLKGLCGLFDLETVSMRVRGLSEAAASQPLEQIRAGLDELETELAATRARAPQASDLGL